MRKNSNKQTYYVNGMHCSSCEILIEKKLRDLKEINDVKASVAKGQVDVEYNSDTLPIKSLNKVFEKDGYSFSDQPIKETADHQKKSLLIPIITGLTFILLFLSLDKMGLSGLVNVSSKSSLPMFFIFGLIAGISTCAALVGGIILAMSKQWNSLYSNTDSTWNKIQPHLIFNAGRLLSYGVFGATLGAVGSKLNFSLKFGPIFVIAVSIFMILLALQMLGIKAFKNINIRLPKAFTGFAANESNFKGRYMPFIMGALTFFLPCGFTITSQGLALISGSAIQGGLIMLLFALGTLPMLLVIGLSSAKISQKPKLSERFMIVSGVLVLFFAIFNINSQLNVLGLSNLTDISVASGVLAKNEKKNQSKMGINLPEIVSGKQVIKMEASSQGYSPSKFVVRVGVPVRWEITDKGTSGCTNAVISKSLFDGDIPLTPGTTSVKEFTPNKTGTFKFSCWMGMVSGTIEVVDEDGSVSVNDTIEKEAEPKIIQDDEIYNASCGVGDTGGSCGCGCGGN